MTTVSAETPHWSLERWCVFFALIFGAQLVLIFWLGRPAPLRPSAPISVPRLRLAGTAASEVLALSDQTLFALPHLQSFSGPAWLRNPPLPFRRSEWSEPAKWLPLPSRELGEDFDRFIATNQPALSPSPARSEPQLTAPDVAPLTVSLRRSGFRIEGELSKRPILNAFDLPSWPYAELLTNTVVQLLVDGEGKPISGVQFGKGSGLAAADEYALVHARAARFETRSPAGPGRIADPLRQLTWGTLIFEWHTLPPPATNSPAGNSQP
jgi:hypothetical protein